MSRGRKRITVSADSGWGTVFYNSVGTYVQLINNKLSEKFKKKPLSNYIKILGGYSFKTSEYTKQGVPIIRISDFNNEKVNLDEIVYYPESNKLKKFELVEGDIIIALTGGTIAKLGIVQEGLGKLYLNQRVGKFHILNPKLFEKEYVYWIARSVQSIIKNLAWGAAIPNVSPKQIEKLEFPIPHRDIQKGIIRFLNDLKDENINTDSEYFDFSAEQEIILLQKNQILADSLSKELFNQIDIVKKLRQQILQEAIQGKLVPQDPIDEPASVLLQKIKAEKEKLINEKKLKKSKTLLPIKKEEIPFTFSSKLHFCRLGEICTVEKGNLGITKAIPGKYPLVALSKERLSHNEYQFDCRGVIVPLISSTGHGHASMKRIHYQEGKFSVGNILCCIFPFIDGILNEKFLFYYLDNYKEEFFVKKMKGAANVSLKVSSIEETPIPLIPIRAQKKFEEIMQTLEEIEQNIKHNQLIAEQLMQSALKEALEPKVS